MRIIVAPDKFKGSLSAGEVAEAMTKGARRVFPAATFQLRPLADGGEGTVDALLTAAGGRITNVDVTGPLGERVPAPLGLLADGRVVLEMASASGLGLLRSARDALQASSRGTGELIRAGLSRTERPGEIVVGVGGSASTDGGTGAATALGWRFLDARGKELPAGGGALRHLARIDGTGVSDEIERRSVRAACDVDNALVGDNGAARVYAPQKGASTQEVAILEEGLEVLATRLHEDVGIDVRDVAGGGAGGGMGAGLAAFFNASLGPGFDVVSKAIQLADTIAGADYVITGEGRLDEQSLRGKTPIGVARIAAAAGVPCVAVAGDLTLGRRTLRAEGITSAVGLLESAGPQRALTQTGSTIAAATEGLLKQTLEQEGGRRRGRGWRLRRPERLF